MGIVSIVMKNIMYISYKIMSKYAFMPPPNMRYGSFSSSNSDFGVLNPNLYLSDFLRPILKF